jgi:hypothetical protein
MDVRRSFYLSSKQDDLAEFAAEPDRSKDVGFSTGALSGLLRRLICHA